jgi:hypothetical protein
LPADCDDEYWDHPDPEKRFKQPPGKPSLVTAFISYIKLHQVLALSLRTIVSDRLSNPGKLMYKTDFGFMQKQYAIDKSKILLGVVGQQWEQQIVAELDSALNKWVDSVPDHRAFHTLLFLIITYFSLVRWDPKREDDNFFNQSVSLYGTYYYIQIVIHRPFIPSSRKPSPLAFPSLAICTNAARSCARILDIQVNRNNDPPPQMQVPVCISWLLITL